jgi:O-antigen ligase
MPVHLRALVVILVFATVVFALSRRAATEFTMGEPEFNRRRNIWFTITVLAFGAHNFWLFMILSAMVLLIMRREEHNTVALYALLMFAVPPITQKVPGFGLLNQLLELDYTRLLSLTLLLPAYFLARREVRQHSEGWVWVDFCLLAYLMVQLGLRLQLDSVTNTLRYGVYALIDVVLPYYVASRSLRSAKAYREALMGFCLAALILALVAAFESVRHWLLYGDVVQALGLKWGYGKYLGRSALLRAQGPTGQPIVLGCIFVLGTSYFLAMKRYVVQHQRIWWLGMSLILCGLIGTVSRGPWVGAFAAFIVYRMAGPKALGGLFKAGIALALLVAAVMLSPLKETVVDFLPFVGTVEAENVVYRQRMFEASIDIILQNPWFGSTDYVAELIALDLVIGGMVDIVNTYVGVGLANGLVGLGSFIGVFFFAGLSVVRWMRRLPDPECEERTIGQGLLAALVGICVTIATVSSISFIPLMYWFVAGLCVGYPAMVKRKLNSLPVPVPHPEPVNLQRGFGARPTSRPA